MENLIGVGEKLKKKRQQKGMTLKDLSQEVNLSIGYLSQLERGISSIPVNRLSNIATALGVELSYFVDSVNKKEAPISKSYERELLYIENNLSYEYRITNNIYNKVMMPKLVELQPGFVTEESHYHEGEEFIYVLEGILNLEIDEHEYVLYPGDTAHIDSSMKHVWKNKTCKTTKILNVNTPNPFFRENK